MAQNDSSFPTGGNSSFGGTTTTGTGTGTRSPSADFTVGTSQADTARPTGTTTTSTGTTGSFQTSGQSESYSPDYERTDYQPAGRAVVLAERTRSRPSTAVIIGSAIAGAVAGGAIPFMLSGRKSSGTIALDERREAKTYRSDGSEFDTTGGTSGSYRR